MTILRKLAQPENDPYGYSTTALVSQPERRRLRVGDYRVVYTVDNGELVVWIIRVGHRSTRDTHRGQVPSNGPVRSFPIAP